jgi:uncharacterized membrane protein
MPIQSFLFYLACSALVAYLGRNYRFGFWGYFFASLFFSPLVGFILVIAAKPARNPSSDIDRGNVFR